MTNPPEIRTANQPDLVVREISALGLPKLSQRSDDTNVAMWTARIIVRRARCLAH